MSHHADTIRRAHARILRTIQAGSYGNREELAAALGCHPNSKGFANGLGRLRGLGLVDGLRISREVFA